MKPVHILLAEDNPAEQRIFEIAAELSGLDRVATIQCVPDGEEVIKNLELSALSETPYDLLILDLNMPRISGLMVLKHLQSDFPTDKPLTIVLTNSDNPGDLRSARNWGWTATSKSLPASGKWRTSAGCLGTASTRKEAWTWNTSSATTTAYISTAIARLIVCIGKL